MKTIKKIKTEKRKVNLDILDFSKIVSKTELHKIPPAYHKMKKIKTLLTKNVKSTSHRSQSLNNPGYYKPISQF
jgi:hypothetical protein